MNRIQLALFRFAFFNSFALIFYLAFGIFLGSWLAFLITLNFMVWVFPYLIKDVSEFQPQIQAAIALTAAGLSEIFRFIKGFISRKRVKP